MTMPIEPHPNNQVRIYRCESWSDFTREVRKNRPWPQIGQGNSSVLADVTIFRGHSDPSWRLMSRLERKLEYGLKDPATQAVIEKSIRMDKGLDWYDSVCNRIIERFRRYAAGRIGFDSTAHEDVIWALGRHFGLITPLLDWTESPYVAAFFAFEDFYKRLEIHDFTNTLATKHDYVHVWGLRLWEEIEKENEFEILRASPYAAGRQRAQSGLFTRLRSVGHLDLFSYLESLGKAHLLERYEISGKTAVKGIRDLSLMNITGATLFPDLTGAALEANFNSDIIHFISSEFLGHGSDCPSGP